MDDLRGIKRQWTTAGADDADDNNEPKQDARASGSATTAQTFGFGSGSSMAARYLMQHGWGGAGAGLGVQGTGRSEPVPVSQKLGRAGLGADSDLQSAPQTWAARQASLDIRITFLSSKSGPRDSYALVRGSMCPDVHRTGSAFAPRGLLDEMFAAKTALDACTDNRRFREARSRSNPFEKIAKGIFMNRAALKTAELDHWLHFTASENLIPEERDILFFADVCAGPGGFTEYVYWRRGWRCRGWGLTLAGDQDFKLHNVNAQTPVESFCPLYGPFNDGDITRRENVESFAREVGSRTLGRGLSLCLADGGIDVGNQENRQEWLTKHIIIGQFATALAVLRVGGTFICKLFDTFTDFTVSLIYIMYEHFDEISIIKPVQSRPANSERYLVCRGARRRSPAVVEYLLTVMDQLRNEKKAHGIVADGGLVDDVISLLPVSEILANEEFSKYVEEANSYQLAIQVIALQDLRKYYLDLNLPPPVDQQRVGESAMELWGIPLTKMFPPLNSSIMELFHFMLREIKLNESVATRVPTFQSLQRPQLQRMTADTFYLPLFRGKLALLIGAKEGSALLFIQRPMNLSEHSLHRLPDVVLPRATLVLIEVIRSQHRLPNHANNPEGTLANNRVVWSVLDLMFVGGDNLCEGPKALRLEQRLDLAKTLLSHATVFRHPDVAPVVMNWSPLAPAKFLADHWCRYDNAQQAYVIQGDRCLLVNRGALLVSRKAPSCLSSAMEFVRRRERLFILRVGTAKLPDVVPLETSEKLRLPAEMLPLANVGEPVYTAGKLVQCRFQYETGKVIIIGAVEDSETVINNTQYIAILGHLAHNLESGAIQQHFIGLK